MSILSKNQNYIIKINNFEKSNIIVQNFINK